MWFFFFCFLLFFGRWFPSFAHFESTLLLLDKGEIIITTGTDQLIEIKSETVIERKQFFIRRNECSNVWIHLHTKYKHTHTPIRFPEFIFIFHTVREHIEASPNFSSSSQRRYSICFRSLYFSSASSSSFSIRCVCFFLFPFKLFIIVVFVYPGIVLFICEQEHATTMRWRSVCQ